MGLTEPWAVWIEAPLWILLVASLASVARRAGPTFAGWRLDLPLLLLALGLRLAVEPGPANDFTPHANFELPFSFAFRAYVRVPLPGRLLAYDAAGGLPALALWNTLLGTASVLLLRRLVEALTGQPRAAWLAAGLVAVTPLFVRLDTSDSVASPLVFLWLLCLGAVLRSRREDGWDLQALALACVGVGALLRPDVIALFAAVPFVGRSISRWPLVWQERGRLAGWMAGMAIGVILHLLFFHEAVSMLGSLGLGSVPVMLLFAVARLLFVYSFDPLGPFPLAFPVLGWIFLAEAWKRGRWNRLAVYASSLLAVSVGNLLSGHGVFFLDSYNATYTLVPLLVSITAATVMLDRLLNQFGQFAPSARILLVAGGLLLGLGFVLPYPRAWSFQEEYRFLQGALPPGPATVLVHFDDIRPRDLDCCLYLPSPLLGAERPDLRWVALPPETEPGTLPADLAFDFYFPGSIVAASPELAGRGMGGGFLDAESIADTQRYIVGRQRLSEEIRKRYGLQPVATSRNRPAEAWYQSVFPDDRMDLTLWGRPTP